MEKLHQKKRERKTTKSELTSKKHSGDEALCACVFFVYIDLDDGKEAHYNQLKREKETNTNKQTRDDDNAEFFLRFKYSSI